MDGMARLSCGFQCHNAEEPVMEQSPNLSLTYVMPQQSQKHVTVNETFRRLDALVQLSVISDAIAAQPSAPAEGDRYILPDDLTGADWGSYSAGNIAAFQDGAWTELVARTGWQAWVASRSALLVFDGAAWSEITASGLSPDTVPKFGVNTDADMINRLAVKADATLFSHDDITPGTGDMRQVLNKAASAGTVSQLYQTGFSGRAETGLTGDDDFTVKVSPDGAVWRNGLVIDKDTGAVRLPNTPAREFLDADRDYYVRTDGDDANDGLADSAGGAFRTIQKAIDTMLSLDMNIRRVRIFVRAGVYNEAVTVTGLPVGSVLPELIGDTTNPANVVTEKIFMINQARLKIDGLRMYGDSGIEVRDGAFAKVDNIIFAGSRAIYCWNAEIDMIGATVEIESTVTRMIIAYNRALIDMLNADVTVNNNVWTGAACIFARNQVFISLQGTNFIGSANGARYNISRASFINTEGGGADLIPGDVAGTTDAFGSYYKP